MSFPEERIVAFVSVTAGNLFLGGLLPLPRRKHPFTGAVEVFGTSRSSAFAFPL